MDTGRRKNSKVGTLHPEAWEAKSKPWKKIHRNGCQSRHMFRSPIHEGARWRYHLYYRIHCQQSKKKRFIDSYFKSIYPESFGRAWTLGGPPVPPSLVRRSGSPDLLVRSDRKFSAVEGMPLGSNLSKASQKSNTTETKKTSGTAMGVGLGLPAKIPDDAYGADSDVYSRSLRQIGIGARSLLSGALDGLSLGLAKPGTTLSDYLGLPKSEKGTPEELVSGLIRGAADGAGYLFPGAGLAKAAAAYPKAKMLGEYLASAPYLQTGLGGLVGLLDVMGKSGGD